MDFKFKYLEKVKVINKLSEIYGLTVVISGFSKGKHRNAYSVDLDKPVDSEGSMCYFVYEEELESTGEFSEEFKYSGSSIRVSQKGEIISMNIIDPDD